MSRHCPRAWTTIALALAFGLASCNDLSQRHLGGLGRDDVAEAPKPAPALAIANPPPVARVPANEEVQKATFVPEREAPKPDPNPIDPNSQPAQPPLRILFLRAAQTYASIDSYIYRLRRSETVNGKKFPEEIVSVEVRRTPYSVHLKWLGDRNKGREVIYVQGRYDNKMQVNLAANDLYALMGRRQQVAVDDPMVKSESRYPITETGFGSLINRFGHLVVALEQGDTRGGTLKYLGPVKRDEFTAPVEAAHQVIPAKSDPLLPTGGQRWWYFDATHGLPVLIITKDASDQIVEYYCHDRIQWPVRLDDDDFNPDRQWRK